MKKSRLVALAISLASMLVGLVAARADDDMEDLVILTRDPKMAAAVQQIGRVPLSSNTVGYDPCDDPQADAARKTGCVANGKIEHIIYIVLENHTFDNYFSQINIGEERVPGADVATAANDVPQVLGPNQVPDGAPDRWPTTRFHLTEFCGWKDLEHGWPNIHGQTDNGKLDGYLQWNSKNSPTMGYFDAVDLTYYYSLAKTFAIADRLFTSAATQSWPNHYYTVSGTCGGYINNDLPVLQDDPSRVQPKVDLATGTVTPPETGHMWRTIFDSLEDGGVSWKIYMSNIAIPMAFSNFKKWAATGHVTTIAEFYKDLAAGTLPQVVYLAPVINFSDEHPATGNHQRGQLQTATLVNALIASPMWATSAMFITYDDSGGWYDHVPSPRAYQPNDHCGETTRATPANCVNGTWTAGSKAGYATPLADDRGDKFDLLGARVPFTIVSPWVKKPVAGKGYASHHDYENATILSFIEWRFGLPSLNTRTRAYKEGWRNPTCDWDTTKLAAAQTPSDETRALSWSAALLDPFRTVRCEDCPASDPFCPAVRDVSAHEADRAKLTNGSTMTLAFQENRYLDPLLDPFDFSKKPAGLLDGVSIVASLPLPPANTNEAVHCPFTGDVYDRDPRPGHGGSPRL